METRPDWASIIEDRGLTKVQRAALKVMGCLAASICDDWSSDFSVRERLSWIFQLLDDVKYDGFSLGFSGLLELESMEKWLSAEGRVIEIYASGQKMKEWPGPYGGTCSLADLRAVRLSENIFPNTSWAQRWKP